MRRVAAFGLVGVALWALSASSAGAAAEKPLGPSSATVGGGFGVHVKDELATDEALTRLVDAGFSFVRFSIGWSDVEHRPGYLDWARMDSLIARMRAHGLKMVIPLLGGNAAYDGRVPAPPHNVDHVRERTRAPSSAVSVDAYARFAAQAVARYGSQDIVWEIWNEPDLPRFWPPRADAAAFIVLAERACKTMRIVAPDATIIGPALGRVPDPADRVTPAFWESFLRSEAASCLDAFSVHPYRHGGEPPEAAAGDYRVLYFYLAKHRRYVPLVNSEWGYTNTQLSEGGQADYVLRTRLMDMIWGVPLSIWYEAQDSGGDPSDAEDHFGLLRRDGSPKPAFSYLTQMLPLLRDAALERALPSDDLRDWLLLLRHVDGSHSLIGWSLRYGSEPQTEARFVADGTAQEKKLSPRPALLAYKTVVDDAALVPEAPHD